MNSKYQSKKKYMRFYFQISSKSMEIMLEMNKYMKRYSNYQVNILVASKLTLKLYLALRRFHGAVRDNVSRRYSNCYKQIIMTFLSSISHKLAYAYMRYLNQSVHPHNLIRVLTVDLKKH